MSEKIEVGVTIKGTGNASTQLNALDKGIKKAGTGMSGLIKATDAFTGGAASGMISAYSGTLKFIKGLKLTKIALISTGIGALVVGVGALVGWFMSSEENAKKLKVTLAGLGAVVQRVGGFFKGVGGFIAGLFGGSVTKAVSNYRGEMDKMPGSMQDAVTKAEELERGLQRLAAGMRELSLDQMDLNIEMASGNLEAKKYLERADDTSRAMEQRIRITEKANGLETQLLNKRQEMLETESALLYAAQQAGDHSMETWKLLKENHAKQASLQAETWNSQRTQSARLNKLRDEESKKAEEAAEKQKASADKVAEAERAKADAIRAAEEARVKSMMESVEQARDVAFAATHTAEEVELENLENHSEKLIDATIDQIARLKKAKEEGTEWAEGFFPGELDLTIKMLADLEDAVIAQETEIKEKHAAIREKAAIDEQAARIKLEDELFALTLTAKEREELAIRQQFDNRIAIAGDDEGLIKSATERKLLDLQAIEDKAAAERVAKEEAVAQAVKAARMSVVQAGFQALGVMAKTEEGTKALAISQILVNQGIAMSNAVVAGLSAAAKMPQPAGLFAAPGFVASALAIALTSFASIKGVMNQAGAATAGVGGGGGSGGQGIASNREGPTLGLTPDISESLTPGSIPPINAYVVQTQLADQNSLAAQIKAAVTL